MAIVLITPAAEQDLNDIWDYVAETSVERADQLLDLIHEKCQMLAEFPEMGRARHELIVNLRSFTVKKHVIFYLPVASGIEVLPCLYGARDLHRVFDEMIGEPNTENS